MFYYKRILGSCVILITILLIMTSCSSSETMDSNSSEKAIVQPKASATLQSSADKGQVEKAFIPKGSNKNIQKITYSGEVHGQVKQIKQAEQQLTTLATKYNAYITSSNELTGIEERSYHVIFRVPQEKFQAFLAEVKKITKDEPSVKLQSTDVSEEYVDLQSRLKAKEIIQTRLYDFMKQAKDAKDLIEISTQLGQVETEIEQIKGRIQYLDHQVAYSTLSVHVAERYTPVGNSNQSFWEKVSHTFTTAFLDFYLEIQWLFLALIRLLPILICLSIVGYLLYRYIKRRRQTKSLNKDTDSDKN